MKFGLPETTLEMMQKTFARHPEIEHVKIFGSRAIGNYKYHSDIDLVLNGNINDNLLGCVISELEELPTPYKFDVQKETGITHEELRQHIRQYGKIIYTK